MILVRCCQTLFQTACHAPSAGNAEWAGGAWRGPWPGVCALVRRGGPAGARVSRAERQREAWLGPPAAGGGPLSGRGDRTGGLHLACAEPLGFREDSR